MEKDTFLHWLASDPGKAVVAGALGGVVRWLTLQERPRDGMASMIVGAICALYLGPLAVPIIEPMVGKIATNPEQTIGFGSFVIGIGGMSASGFLIAIWRGRRAAAAKLLEGEADAE